MPNLSVVAVTLLLAGAPLVVLAQTSTNPYAVTSPSSTFGSGTSTAPGKLNAQDIKTKLESLGYTQVKDIVSTPEGVTAKAVKGDKRMALVIDSFGNVKESQIGP